MTRWRLRLALTAFVLLAAASLGEATAKTLVYAVPGPPESLDSAKAYTERSIWATWLICDALLNVSRDGQRLEPALAESWTVSPDGRQVRMRLRQGVLFHDGTPLDSKAVKASFERQFRTDHELYSPEPRNTKDKLLSELVAEIRAEDPLVVSLTLKYPGLHYLSQIDIVSPAAVAQLGKEFQRKPVCTGPFKPAEWSKEQLVLTANEQYWAGRPRIDRVVFRFIPEERVVADALMRGDVHFVPMLRDPIFFERLRESPGARLLPVPGLNIYYLGFYTDRPPFDNPSLRRAVAHAINGPRLTLFLGRGAAVPAKGPLAPAIRAHDPTIAQAAYDPEAGRQLLTKAGFDATRPVRLVHDTAVTIAAEVAGAIQSDLRRLGIAAELLGKPTSRDVVAAVRAREGDMFLYSWHLRAPYPERLLVPLYHSSASEATNLTRYRNPALDGLLDQALRLPEGPEQTRAYQQAQRLIVENAPMVFLYHATVMAAHSDKVQGLELNLGVLPHDKLVKVDLVP